jgi:hypothetical protein
MQATIQIDTNNVLRSVASFSLGVSLAGWDRYLSTMAGGFGVTPDPQTVAAIRDANLSVLRLSNGSGAMSGISRREIPIWRVLASWRA